MEFTYWIAATWRDGWFGKFTVAFLVFAILFVPFGVYQIVKLTAEEQKQWDNFAVTHDCKKIGQTSASSGVVVGMALNGQMGMGLTSEAGKTGWLCNDGVTYWRETPSR